MTIDIWGVNYQTGEAKPLKATKVEVLPREHKLVIRILSDAGLLGGEYRRYLQVAFNADAGHEYKIKCPWVGFGKGGRIDIKDVTTGSIIFSQPFK